MPLTGNEQADDNNNQVISGYDPTTDRLVWLQTGAAIQDNTGKWYAPLQTSGGGGGGGGGPVTAINGAFVAGAIVDLTSLLTLYGAVGDATSVASVMGRLAALKSDLDAINTNVATSANQATTNTTLGTLATQATLAAAKADLDSIVTNTATNATAANQATTNTTLATLATSANQATSNTSLASILTALQGTIKTAMQKTLSAVLYTTTQTGVNTWAGSGDITGIGNYTELFLNINFTGTFTGTSVQFKVQRKDSLGNYITIDSGLTVTAIGGQTRSIGAGLSVNQSFGNTVQIIATFNSMTTCTFTLDVYAK